MPNPMYIIGGKGKSVPVRAYMFWVLIAIELAQLAVLVYMALR